MSVATARIATWTKSRGIAPRHATTTSRPAVDPAPAAPLREELAWRMRAMDVRTEKQETIELILENPVYMPDSGMVESLRKSLMGLSLSDLSNLRTIIDLKVEMDVKALSKHRCKD
jgi:hypothetical protein